MMNNHIKIRCAHLDDLQDLAELLKQLFNIEKDFTFEEKLVAAGIKLLLEDQDKGCIFVAEKDNKVIGMGSIQILISTAKGSKVGIIEDLIITKQYRHLGIGTKILNSLEQWADKKKLSRLQLLADKTNTPALVFYNKHSWQNTNLICLRKNT